MHFNIVEIFLFKLNNRMVGPLNLSLAKSTNVGVVLLAKGQGVKVGPGPLPCS